MQLKEYIQGNRRGKEANRLEREAMNDPFLQDALEGLDSVPGDHTKAIERLEKKIAHTAEKPERRGNVYLYWSIAASILLIIGIGTFFFMNENDANHANIVMIQTIHNEYDTSLLRREAAQDTTQDLSVEEVATPSAPQEPSVEMESSAALQTSTAATVKSFIEHEEDNMGTEKVYFPLENENVTLFENNAYINDVAVVANNTQKKISSANAPSKSSRTDVLALSETSQNPATSKAEANADWSDISETFGEKEFQEWCEKIVNPSVCDKNNITVKVSFFIDETGKPTSIKYKKYTCEKAKEEIAYLLSASPAWTNTNRTVTITIKIR